MSFKNLWDNSLPSNFKLEKKDKIISNFKIACGKLEFMYKIKPKDYVWLPTRSRKKMGYQNHLEHTWRIDMGYAGIGFNDGIRGILKTKEVIPGIAITDDHVIGATLCGQIIDELLKKENYNPEYLINNYLFDNLYLWGTIRMTREQHKNVLQNRNTLEEKLMLKHYKNIDLEDLIVI